MEEYKSKDVVVTIGGKRIEGFTYKGYSCSEYKTYVVDLCKTTEYTDDNGVTWWSDKYRGNPAILELYKGLEKYHRCGILVEDVFEKGGIISAKVKSGDDLEGLYLNPKITATLTEDNHIESVEYDSIALSETSFSEEYAVEGLLPCRLIKGEVV